MAGSESKPLGRGLQDRVLVIVEVAVGLAVVAAIMGKAYGMAPTVIFLLCGVAATYTGYNVLRMVSSLQDPTLEVQGRLRDEEREALEYEKKLLVQGIKELEADYGVGKVDARDYETLKRTAEERAVEIIARLREDDARWTRKAEQLLVERVPGIVDRIQPPPDPPRESQIAPAEAPETLAPPSVFDDRPARWKPVGDRFACTACGGLNDSDGRFCNTCGRPRAPEAA